MAYREIAKVYASIIPRVSKSALSDFQKSLRAAAKTAFSGTDDVVKLKSQVDVSGVEKATQTITMASSIMPEMLSTVGKYFMAGGPVALAVGIMGDKINEFKDWFKGSYEGANENLRSLVDGAGQFSLSLLSGIVDVGEQAFEILSNVFTNVAALFVNALREGISIVADTIGQLISDAFTSYIPYEQAYEGMRVIFDGATESMEKYANQAWFTAGSSAQNFYTQATLYGNALKRTIPDMEEVVELVNMAQQDMADNINRFGSDPQYVEAAYQAMARQSYILLDNLRLGYMGTATEAARLINDSGILDELGYDPIDTHNKTTINEQLLARGGFATLIRAIHIIQERLGVTGTTIYEAEETMQGSFYALAAAWDNFIVGIADDSPDMDYLIDSMMTALSNAAKNAVPRLGKIIKNITDYIPGFLKRAKDELYPQIVNMINDTLDSFTGGILEQPATILKDLFGTFNTSLESGDFTALVEKLASVIGESIQKAVPYAAQFLTGIMEHMPGIIGAFASQIPAILDSIRASIVNMAKETVFGDLISNLDEFLPEFSEIFTSIAETFGPTFSQILKSTLDIFKYIRLSFQDVDLERFFGKADWDTFFSDTLPHYIVIIEAFLEKVWDSLLPIIGVLAEHLPKILNELSPLLDTFIETISPYLEEIGRSAAVNLEKVLQGLENWLGDPEAAESFVENLASNFGLFTDNWNIIAGDIADAFGSFERSKDTIESIVNGFIDWFTMDLVDKLLESFTKAENVVSMLTSIDEYSEIYAWRQTLDNYYKEIAAGTFDAILNPGKFLHNIFNPSPRNPEYFNNFTEVVTNVELDGETVAQNVDTIVGNAMQLTNSYR